MSIDELKKKDTIYQQKIKKKTRALGVNCQNVEDSYFLACVLTHLLNTKTNVPSDCCFTEAEVRSAVYDTILQFKKAGIGSCPKIHY